MLDFSQTEQLVAHTALLLYAVIEDCKQCTGVFKGVRLRMNTANDQVASILRASGIHQLVTGEQHRVHDFSCLPVISGNFSEGYRDTLDEVVESIKQEIYKGKLTPIEEMRMGSAVQEAVLNVLHHAYPASTYSERVSHMKWWMIYGVIQNQLFLAILDRGVGIPATLKGKDWVTGLLGSFGVEKLDALSDVKRIELALKKGESRTQQQERGLGGPTIMELVDKNEYGQLSIISNRGIYCRAQGAVESIRDSRLSMQGTLVQWNIRLSDG